jgi:hypothetical protein
MAEEEKVVIEAVVEIDPIAQKDAEIAKLVEERDNYKTVALKRLGKLPADSEFLGEGGKEIQDLIDDKVKEALLDKELARKQQEKDDEIRRMTKENAELRLALKNQPGKPLGGDGGNSTEVKDNVFSPEQLAELTKKAKAINADPEKFIESAKKKVLARR